MVVINSISDKYFTLDGVQFAKIYQPLAQGSDAIGIYSIYDTRKQLVNSTKYTEFTVNGVTYGSQTETIKAILTSVWAGVSGYDVEDLQNRVENLEENQVTGVVVYETYAELPATGTLLVSYKVSNDTTESNNGYWHWDGADYVKDLELNQSLTDSITKLDANKSIFNEAVIQSSLTKYYDTTSVSLLGTTYSFGIDADYIEFEVRLDGDITTNFNALGLLGDDNNLYNTMGWISATEFRIRDNIGTWIAFTGLTSYYELGDIVKVKVLRNGSNFELYFNDVLAKSVSIGAFTTMYIDRISGAYQSSGAYSLFSMRNLVLHTSATGDLSINQIWKEDLFHTEITVSNDTGKGIIDDPNPNILLSFDPTGGIDSNGEFVISVKSKENKFYYIQYSLVHEIDAGIRRDNWRIRGAYLYKYTGGSLVDTGIVLLNIGETEFAYKHTGASDFTGGFHGDQELTNVDFFVDGVRLTDLASSFDIECSEFSYIQHSEMFETDNATPVVEANNIKHTIFNIDRVNVFIRQTWLAIVNIDLCYNCLVPTYFDVADYYTNETFVIEDVTDAAPNGNVLIGNERHFRCWNEDTELACQIDVEFKEDLASSDSKVWCSPGAYNKLYVNYASGGYNTSVNEVFESSVDIIFKVGK